PRGPPVRSGSCPGSACARWPTAPSARWRRGGRPLRSRGRPRRSGSSPATGASSRRWARAPTRGRASSSTARSRPGPTPRSSPPACSTRPRWCSPARRCTCRTGRVPTSSVASSRPSPPPCRCGSPSSARRRSHTARSPGSRPSPGSSSTGASGRSQRNPSGPPLRTRRRPPTADRASPHLPRILGPRTCPAPHPPPPLKGTRMISRRSFLTAGVVAGSVAALTACGLDSGSGGSSSAPSASDGGEQGGGATPVPFTIYTARDKELAEQVVADFEAAYPEWAGMATILTLGAQEALERVRAEKANPQGDIWWGGTRQQLSQGAADGVLAPAPQEVIDAVAPQYRDADGLWIGEMKLAELFMVNTDMMSIDEAPADWDDLLAPEMKDQIAIRDVEASGTMRSIYCAMIDHADASSPEPGYEWLLKLDANTKVYAANPTDLYQRISRQE